MIYFYTKVKMYIKFQKSIVKRKGSERNEVNSATLEKRRQNVI